MSDGIIMVVIYVSLKNVCSIPSISLFLLFSIGGASRSVSISASFLFFFFFSFSFG